MNICMLGDFYMLNLQVMKTIAICFLTALDQIKSAATYPLSEKKKHMIREASKQLLKAY